MGLRAVYFDFGGTLAQSLASDDARLAWLEAAKEHGVRLAEDRLPSVMAEATRRFGPRVYEHLGRTREFWIMHDRWILEQLGVTNSSDILADSVQAWFDDPSRMPLYPETLEVLERVRPAVDHLGVISNATDRLDSILKYHRIRSYFDSVTFSQAVGAEKPDVRIFRDALRGAGCEPNQALHIGNSWEADYLGAAGAGMRAVWLNRLGRPAPRPCAEVKDLRGLERFLVD
jgi:HAD superfamily hydrolase (TIGR01549 family)